MTEIEFSVLDVAVKWVITIRSAIRLDLYWIIYREHYRVGLCALLLLERSIANEFLSLKIFGYEWTLICFLDSRMRFRMRKNIRRYKILFESSFTVMFGL